MRIFLTGSTGFIGRHLKELLSSCGHELLLLYRNCPDMPGSDSAVRGDLNDISTFSRQVKSFGPEVVIHLAWQGLPDYSRSMCELNEKISCDLFDLAVDCGCKVLLSAGSCWEYASRKGRLSESSALDVTFAFSKAKNAIMDYGSKICQKYGVKFYWPRLFFVYGSHQRNNSLIPYIINSARNGLAPDIKKPDNSNDFIFVRDVASAVEALIRYRPEGEIFNIGSGFSISVRQVVKTVADVLRTEINCPVGNYIENENYWADIRRMKNVNNWIPLVSLEQGITQMIENVRVKSSRK